MNYSNIMHFCVVSKNSRGTVLLRAKVVYIKTPTNTKFAFLENNSKDATIANGS